MSTRFMLVSLVILFVCGCEPTSREHTLSRDHDAKAALLCKKDKGLKRVVDSNGPNFTAECNSGIIVTGSTD